MILMQRNKSRWQQYAIDKCKMQIVTAQQAFTQSERDANVSRFIDSPEHKKLWERLEETEKRMPWCRQLVASLRGYAEFKGVMTDKQKSLATSLYLDCCMTTDDKIQ